VMDMLWRRSLKDREGKNWRRIYKVWLGLDACVCGSASQLSKYIPLTSSKKKVSPVAAPSAALRV
jgi:hypothetical protein